MTRMTLTPALLFACACLAWGQAPEPGFRDSLRLERIVSTQGESPTSIQIRLDRGEFRVASGEGGQRYGYLTAAELQFVRDLLTTCQFPQLPPTMRATQPDPKTQVSYSLQIGLFGKSVKTRTGGVPFNPVFQKLDALMDRTVARTQQLGTPVGGDVSKRKLTGHYVFEGRAKAFVEIDGRRYPLAIESDEAFARMVSLRGSEVSVIASRVLGHDEFKLEELVSPSMRMEVPVTHEGNGYVKVDGKVHELAGHASGILTTLVQRTDNSKAVVDGFATQSATGRPVFVVTGVRVTYAGHSAVVVGTRKGKAVAFVSGQTSPGGMPLDGIELAAPSVGIVGSVVPQPQP